MEAAKDPLRMAKVLEDKFGESSWQGQALMQHICRRTAVKLEFNMVVDHGI